MVRLPPPGDADPHAGRIDDGLAHLVIIVHNFFPDSLSSVIGRNVKLPQIHTTLSIFIIADAKHIYVMFTTENGPGVQRIGEIPDVGCGIPQHITSVFFYQP